MSSLIPLQQVDGPKRVQICKSGKWHMTVVSKTSGEIVYDGPYRCRSWRHAGECQEHHSRVLMARALPVTSWLSYPVFAVVTFDQTKTPDVQQQYATAGKLWARLRHRLKRKWTLNNFLMVWERFKKGGVHGHIIMDSPGLWIKAGLTKHAAEWVYEWRQDCEQCGFGRVAYLERMQERKGAGYYIAKVLAYNAKGKDKRYEVPCDAPCGFRRFSASQDYMQKMREPQDDLQVELRRVSD